MNFMKSSQRQKLSKNVLGMKFMRRSVLNDEKQQNEEDNKRLIDDEHWVLDIPELLQKESEFDVEDSLSLCHDFQFGRMSFQNFNPEIEKLMAAKHEEQKEKESERREKEVGVDEEEMANRYSALIGTIAKKFMKSQKNKPRNKGKTKDGVQKVKNKKTKSRQFLKPSDD